MEEIEESVIGPLPLKTGDITTFTLYIHQHLYFINLVIVESFKNRKQVER